MSFLSYALKLLGTPDEASLKFLRSDNARRYVKQLPQFPKQNLAARFPNMTPLALDLLAKMLVFDPDQRITGKRKFSFLVKIPNYFFFHSADIEFLGHTVDDALCHPYLSTLHDINDEPINSTPFSFDFEQPSLTEENVKDLIWRESLVYNPDPVS